MNFAESPAEQAFFRKGRKLNLRTRSKSTGAGVKLLLKARLSDFAYRLPSYSQSPSHIRIERRLRDAQRLADLIHPVFLLVIESMASVRC